VTVAHHGSRSSSDPGFVEAIGASVALVSAGHGNRFRHPAGDVLERWQAAGAQVPISAETGAVRIRLGRAGLGVDLRRTSHPRLWDAVRRAVHVGEPSVEE